MWIRVEFNPELALRNISEFKKWNRKLEECIPEDLEVGKIYPFLKSEQRLFWIHGQIPLAETQGGEVLYKPKASIVILEVTHFLDNHQPFTRWFYRVEEIFNDDAIHFECFDPVGTRK